MSLIFAVSWKALELCRPASPAPLQSSDLSNASNASRSSSSSSNSNSNGNQLVLKPPFFTDLTANDLYCHPNLFQLKLTEYIRLLSYVDEFMSLRRAPGFEDLIYPSPAVQLQLQMPTDSHSQSHPRSYSPSSSSTSASSIRQRAAITAAAATTDSPHDSSTIYSGDGETEDSTSPRWTEDYFWVYFGEKELEGESPQTTTTTTTSITTTTDPTTTISNGSSSNRSSSNSDSSSTAGSNMPDHEGDSSRLRATSGGSPHCISSSPYDKSVTGPEPAISVKTKGKEKSSEGPRADTLQNMLDCLPLLGE